MCEVIIPRMDLVLTTRCSLKCESCANLMQYYEKPYDIPLDHIKKYMNRLSKISHEIKQVYVLGGEPFLYADLEEVIKYLNNIEKIKEIIVVTNGTIAWDNDKIKQTFGGQKVVIRISDYGELSKHKEELIEQLEEEEIPYVWDKKEYFLIQAT